MELHHLEKRISLLEEQNNLLDKENKNLRDILTQILERSKEQKAKSRHTK